MKAIQSDKNKFWLSFTTLMFSAYLSHRVSPCNDVKDGVGSKKNLPIYVGKLKNLDKIISYFLFTFYIFLKYCF